jgi:hypothetical protein
VFDELGSPGVKHYRLPRQPAGAWPQGFVAGADGLAGFERVPAPEAPLDDAPLDDAPLDNAASRSTGSP